MIGAYRENAGGPEESLRTSPWWVSIIDGRVVALDEQYVP